MLFVQCIDTLMQILVCLDRDKNSSVGTAGALVGSEKRRTVGLCCLFFVCHEGYQSGLQVRGELRWDFLSKRLPIELVSEEKLTVGLVLFSCCYSVGQDLV